MPDGPSANGRPAAPGRLTTGQATTGQPTGQATTGQPTTGQPTGQATTGQPTTGHPMGQATTGQPMGQATTGQPANDQPTTDLNRLWARPGSTPTRAGKGDVPGGGESGTADQKAAGEARRWSYQQRNGPADHEPEPDARESKPAETAKAAEAANAAEPAETAKAADPADTAKAAETAKAGDAPKAETVAAGDRTGFRLAAFGAVLVVVLFAGYGIGRLNNGVTSASAPPTSAAAGGSMPAMVMDENQPHSHNADGTVTQGGAAATSVGASVGGLSLSSGGLTLVPTQTSFVAGRPERLSFRITGPGGAPITTYAVVHDKMLHLVVIRRDLSGFQHLHPSMAADGTWRIDLVLAQPGIYRMIADFTALVGGKPVATTLGSDLTVAGDYAPLLLPEPVRAVTTNGFAVGYEGSPSTRSTQPILIGVAGPDRAPAVLEPYLGAYGHLVVLRQGDLAYVHVHPETTLVDGKVKFWLSVPSSGIYRMFFDFQVAGQVHTAAWTVEVD